MAQRNPAISKVNLRRKATLARIEPLLAKIKDPDKKKKMEKMIEGLKANIV